jgi:sepiapterin reductase
MQQVILVTGAGKGIGRAIAFAFARAGRHNPDFDPLLVLCSRSQGDLDSISLECRAEGAITETVACDLGHIGEARSLAARILEKHGTIDCLVNNAGVGRFKPFAEMTEEDFDFTMATNLKGTFFLTQALFPVMEKKRSGHIFFITSVAARKAFKHSSVYCMSKFGQRGLVETMRLYARECNVRITDVMPGAVFTPMWGEVDDDFRSLMMMPEDIAHSVVQAYLQPGRTTVEEIVLRPTSGDIQEE